MNSKGNAAADNGARDVLALGAYVPVLREVAEREADGDQHERRGLDQELLDRPGLRPGPEEEHIERAQGGMAESREERGTRDEREQDGDERRADRHELRALRAPFEHQLHAAASAAAPPMSRPMHSGDISLAGCGGDRWPSWMT